MDENKSFTTCNNNSNNVNENFRTLEIRAGSSDSNPKQESSICDNIQDGNAESTAFPVNLKEVFELTSPSSDVNQSLLRETNNVESTVGSYQLSSINTSMKYNEQKPLLWQDDLHKSLNTDMRGNSSSPNCDSFLVKPVSCERLVPVANTSWPHAFHDPDNEQDKLTTQNAINLSGTGERRAFRDAPHLNLLSESHSDNHLGNQRVWPESLHQTVAHKRNNVIVNDVPFHDFSLSRMHPSLEVQEVTNEKNKCWSAEPSTKPWYPTTEQPVKYMRSTENKKSPLPPKKDASCQVDDIPYQSTLEGSLVPSEKSTKGANSDGSLQSAIQGESQSLSQVSALENNIIKPELYTQERNLCVAVGAKPYGKHPRSGMYPCSQCGKAFGDNRSLHRHLIVHSGLRSFHCPECNKSFMLKGDLTRHVRIHSGEKPYACEICHRRFTLKGNLMQHFRTHSAEKQYACTLCSKNYAQKDSLHRHIRAHFGDKPFQCDYCGKRFTLKGDLSRHTLIHSGVKPHVCKFCGRNFSLKGNLRQHIRVHTKLKADFLPTLSKNHTEQRLVRDSTYSHMQKKQMFQNNTSPMFKLPLEVSSIVENLSTPVENGHHVTDYNSGNSNNHQIQTIELAFCSACSRTFPSPESLQKHVQLIHEQSTRLSNKRYLCNVCKKEFSLKGDITRHLNSHNGIKPYQCEQCDKTFTLKSNLRQHLTTHVLSKSFDCPLCSKPFGNRRNLSLHLKRHDQASANFMCTKCGRSFLAKSDHFFHNCSKDDDADSSSQVPLNCSLNSTTMCSSSSSSSPPTTHYTIPSETKLDVPQSSSNSDVYMIKKELLLPLPCNERELNTSNPEDLTQNNHAAESFFNPFYRHLYFATSNQSTMPNLRGLLHPSSELTADVFKMTKAN